MMIPILGFIVSLLFVFSVSMLVIAKVQKTKAELSELRAWRLEHQRRLAAAQSDRAWRGNKQMVMY
jgi:hypothetical protein